MAFIRATCNDCGDVELRSPDLHIRLCKDTGQATYHFRCPTCHMVEIRTAEPDVVEVLKSAGVDLSVWKLPEEMRERPSASEPAITYDQVIDFHELVITLPDGEFERAVIEACSKRK